MKKLLFVFAFIAMFLYSCNKENYYQNNDQIIENICGAYNIQHNINDNNIETGYSIFNLECLTISKDSLLFIDKISNNEIKTYGFFNTTGTIVEDKIIFDPVVFTSNFFSELYYDSIYSICNFDNAYYSNGVINLKLNIFTHEVTNRNLFNHTEYIDIEKFYTVIAIH